MKPWLVVFGKECVENARDRRVLASALFYGPLVGPVLFAVMLTLVLAVQREQAGKPPELPVVGAAHAPKLIAWLAGRGVRIAPAPDDPERAVRERQVDLVLRIPAGFGEALRAGTPAPLELIHDASRQQTRHALERVRALLGQYGAVLGSQRLRVRGIDPRVAEPIALALHDVSTRQSRAVLVLGMLPYLLILSAFIGGMYLAIDTTAGERERRSLEPLLLSPAGRGQILAGKLLATATFASLSLAMSVAAFAVSVRFVPAADLGMDLRLPATTALVMLLTCLPVPFLAAAMQILVCAFARSFREAQTWAQLLMFVPMVPSLVLVLQPLVPEAWMMAVPLLSQAVLIVELARGSMPPAAMLAGSAAATLAATLLLSLIARRLFYTERFALAG